MNENELTETGGENFFQVHESHHTFYQEGSRRTGFESRLRCSKCRKKGLGLKYPCKKAKKEEAKAMAAAVGAASVATSDSNTETYMPANTNQQAQNSQLVIPDWKPRKRASLNKPRTFCLF